MAKSDLMRELHLAAVLLTRLPLPRLDPAAFSRGARAVWAYPLIGAALGAAALAMAQVALWIGLPVPLAAGLAIATLLALSGAMHEDGLADVADGFWGAQETARRLEIMRDSQIGSYGTLALILGVGLRWSAYAAALMLIPLAVIAAAAVSRAMMAWPMARLPHARSDGLARSVGKVSAPTAAMTVLIGTVITVALCGIGALVAVLAALIATGLVMVIANRKIGGQTGDVLGCVQQVSEIAILIALLAAA